LDLDLGAEVAGHIAPTRVNMASIEAMTPKVENISGHVTNM
jgi:hypothetical protein